MKPILTSDGVPIQVGDSVFYIDIDEQPQIVEPARVKSIPPEHEHVLPCVELAVKTQDFRTIPTFYTIVIPTSNVFHEEAAAWLTLKHWQNNQVQILSNDIQSLHDLLRFPINHPLYQEDDQLDHTNYTAYRTAAKRICDIELPDLG